METNQHEIKFRDFFILAIGVISVASVVVSASAGCTTNLETGCVECGPHWSPWTITCPPQTNCGSLPADIYVSWKSPSPTPGVVLPGWDVGSMSQVGTFDCSTNSTNNIIYINYLISGGVQWTNFSNGYTNFPSQVTNTFTVQAYVVVTSTVPTVCPSPGIVFIGGCNSGNNANNAQAAMQAGGFTLLSDTTTINPYGIKHSTVLTNPSLDSNRKTLGVGEQVNLVAAGAPPGAHITWWIDPSGASGTLSQNFGSSVTYTAPDYASGGSQSCIIYTSYNSPLIPNNASITFTVINPTSINMTKVYNEHTINTVDIGMWTEVYVGPATVNFSAVTVLEESVDGYGKSVDFVGWGCYSKGGPHGITVPVSCSQLVYANLGTMVAIFPTDDAYIGGYGVSAGGTRCSIPVEWKCNNSNYNNFPGSANCDEIGYSTADGTDFDLEVDKCNASWNCKASDPTVIAPAP